MPGQYYPVGIYTRPFVYYKSLEEIEQGKEDTKGAKLKKNTLKGAQQYLNTFGSEAKAPNKSDFVRATNAETARIALDFLRKAAEVERGREIAIIKENLNKMADDSEFYQKLKDAVEGKSDNYYDFILALNASIKGIEKAKEDIQSELERLKEYKRRYNNFRAKIKQMGKTQKNLTNEDIATLRANKDTDIWDESIIWTTQQQRTGRNLRTDITGTNIFKSILSKQSKMSELVQGLLQDNISKILSYNREGFKLEPRHLIVISRLITQKYNELLIEELQKTGDSLAYQKGEYTSTRDKLSPAINDYIDNLLNAPNIIETLDNYAKLYNLDENGSTNFRGFKYRLTQISKLVKNAYEQYRREGGTQTEKEWKAARGIDKSYLERLVSAIDAVSVQIHYVSENNSAEAQRNAFINGVSTVIGKKGGATDVHTRGHFVVETTINDGTINAALEKYQEEVQKRQRAARVRGHSASKASSLSEAERNEALFNEMLSEQEEIAQKALKALDKKQRDAITLKGIFNIHNSVKDYATIDVKTSEYKGATLGSNLDESLAILNKAAMLSGSNMDLNWFKTALINTAPGLIGESIAPVLESYLSIFASFFMFSDAFTNIAQIAREITNKRTSIAKDVHIYNLNGTFYPQSYILTRLYNELNAKYNNYSAEAFSQSNTSIQVNIHNKYAVKAGFKNNAEYKQKGEWNMDEWYEEASAALSSVTLSMSMMKDFIQELQNLFNNF